MAELLAINMILHCRVPYAFPESNSTTLAPFFHDWHATTMTNFNPDKTNYCVLNVVSLHLLIATCNTHDKSWNSHNSLNNVLVLDGMRGVLKFFPMIFPQFYRYFEIPWFWPFFANSMIFPGLENAFVIFQVFHDFPGCWEPCIRMKGKITKCM